MRFSGCQIDRVDGRPVSLKQCHVIGEFIAFFLLSCSATTYGQQNEPKAGQNFTKEIRQRLVLSPYYSVFDNLSYPTGGRKVILSGQVVRASLQAAAEAALKSVEGVSRVQNTSKCCRRLRWMTSYAARSSVPFIANSLFPDTPHRPSPQFISL
jgi:hypothetical protein